MSPRPFKLRRISNPPPVSGFKPYGGRKNSGRAETIFLNLEEYEAIRLCDNEMLSHHEASVIMSVSRPTLTRIYLKARQKIAEALVLGKQIIIEGGKIYFDSDWYSCQSCGSYFNNPFKQEEITACPLCGSKEFRAYNPDNNNDEEELSRCADICICPSCGYETPHRFGFPCKDEICSVCGNHLVRKRSPYFSH
ncbi:MAG: DUF134 domain-containing protein [Bacteroidales bacterium]|nr:DUF134 domain-containing protein [Bacteroidales bacterium]